MMNLDILIFVLFFVGSRKVLGSEDDPRYSFHPGDGIGGTNINIGKQNGRECIDACLQRKKKDPSINGVTMPSKPGETGCWCESNMKGRNEKSYWKSCFIDDTSDEVDQRCPFHLGDGIGGKNIKIGVQKGSQCIDACLKRRKTDPSINGVTVPSNSGAGGCWCESTMKGRNDKDYWKSCFFADSGLEGDYRCRFMQGDGIGGANIKIGKQKGSQCIDACLAMKKTDPSINGVTVPTNNDGSCWCEKNMKGRNGNAWWKSCFIGDAGLDGDFRCTFYPGDGIGGAEFKIGSEKGSQCIDACLERKKTDDSINGVTVAANNKDGCWCERNMLSRNAKTTWKSCFIGVTGIKGDNRCTFYSGDGVGGTEIKVGMQTGSQCIDACLARKKTDDSINGVTITANNKPGCWCERSMSGRNENSVYKSCFIGDTGVTSTCQIKVLSVVDASGGKGKYFSFNMTSLAILKPGDNITFKATNYRSRLSGEVIVWGASNSGSLGNAYGRFNNNPIPAKLGQWSVGDIVIPKNEALCRLGTKRSFGGTCYRDFRKIGCFHRDWLKMTDLLITDLDPTHKNYTTDVDWDNYADSIHSLACRCREKAEGNYKYFAIGFHAECVASKDTVGLEKMFEVQKESGEGCTNGEYLKCDKNHEAECAGAADFDFFYEIINY